MHKISFTGDFGTLEWTPPEAIQLTFNAVPANVATSMKAWMGKMLEGYVCALLDAQTSPSGMSRIEAQTISMVTEVVDKQEGDLASSRTLN